MTRVVRCRLGCGRELRPCNAARHEAACARTLTHRLRWSSVRSCPRKAVYEAEGAPARELTDREERIMFRGRSIGRDYAEILEHTHGADNVERERAVRWPLGVGHVDAFLKTTGTAFEVLSSAHASDGMVRSKLLQVIGYAIYDDAILNVCLVILNPADFSEQRIVVTPSSPLWEYLAREAAIRTRELLTWRETGELPGRVCRHPAQSWAHFCRHAEHCFAGWTPDELDLEEDPATVELVGRLEDVKRRKRDTVEAGAELELEQHTIQDELAERVPPGARVAGPYLVTRSPRTRSSFQLKHAEKDARFPSELLDEFTKTSTFDVWTVKPAPADELERAAAAIDYGEAPF